MPKRAKLPIYKATGGGHCLSVAATVSPTGKRQRLFFTSEAKAEAEKRRILERMRDVGISDVAKAMEILKPYGVSLTVVASEYRDAQEARNKAIPLSDAWVRSVARREGKRRQATVTNMRKAGRRFPGWFMGMNLADIKSDDVKRAVDESSPGASTRMTNFENLRAVINDAVSAGILAENPCPKLEIEKDPSPPPAIFESAEKLRAVFDAALDLHPDSVAAFALMAFAGIRSAELARLEWSDISLENRNIKIPALKSKTLVVRNVEIEPNLLAWLEREPDKSGRIVPKNWKPKRLAVRKKAGISGENNIFRHSYGSYYLSAYRDEAALRANMGHSSPKTFFKHYHRSIPKREALEYWQIAPEGVEIPAVRQIA